MWTLSIAIICVATMPGLVSGLEPQTANLDDVAALKKDLAALRAAVPKEHGAALSADDDESDDRQVEGRRYLEAGLIVAHPEARGLVEDAAVRERQLQHVRVAGQLAIRLVVGAWVEGEDGREEEVLVGLATGV